MHSHGSDAASTRFRLEVSMEQQTRGGRVSNRPGVALRAGANRFGFEIIGGSSSLKRLQFIAEPPGVYLKAV
jgi:hypothetical protein